MYKEVYMLRKYGNYRNGNYVVTIYEDGTKVFDLDEGETELKSDWPNAIDCWITDKCDGACPYCYAGCHSDGKHGNLNRSKLLDSIHPYTEIAINANDLSHPDLENFLKELRSRKLIPNLTINQKHLSKNYDILIDWQVRKLFFGLGVSITNTKNTEEMDMIKSFPNSVAHVIVGIVTAEDLKVLNTFPRMLILGYKKTDSSRLYLQNQNNYKNYFKNLISLRHWLDTNTNSDIVIGFDNVAIDDLGIKGMVSKDEWKKSYLGQEGTDSLFINLVNNTYGMNSYTGVRHELTNDISKMFKVIQTEKGVLK